MEWRLNDSRPIWIQLTEQLTERIASGVYPMEKKLLSVRELASEAGVNPNTMQRALSQLDSQGLTETNRTSGRTVTDNAEVLEQVRRKLAKDKIEAFLDGMEKLGFSRGEIIELLKGERSQNE